ncbi:MAG: DUF1311 domain-containing protein [Paracoccus denitrificans]|uniref:DUF1311 domain-containing protein n=1 Tax=Paracoccus denitrificans TaxID=266 RepID=A0A533I142_PARDE|nr:MAG: DUF1311 domain-containing protein [Paracoccus denitrificans]
MRRSSYQQIIDWNVRRGDQRRLGIELVGQISALRAEVDAIAGIAPLHLQFAPIRLVTILEVFLREVIAELIDGDDAIFERAEKLVKGTKIDLAFAAHVDRRELTIGDFVAHTVSLSAVDGIMSILDTLIGGFAGKLQAVHPRWTEEMEKWPLPPIVADYNAMMTSLARLFEVRHVLTHELPTGTVFDSEELPVLIDATSTFVEATDWSVIEALSGSVPQTQIGMNIVAAEDLRSEEEELEATLEQVSALPGIDGDALQELQAAWVDFANRHASLLASQVEGGSMYPHLWAGEKASLVRDRITQLKGILEGWWDR